MLHHATVPSPLGPLRLAAEGGVLVRLDLPLPGSAEIVDGQGETSGDATLAAAGEQLAAYFAGALRRFRLPLRRDGTSFEQRVWAALCEIPYGETRTYTDLAVAVGSPRAARAVGQANGRNPLAIIVPCHRVVAAGGKLGGYGGGLPAKRLLLDLERRGRA